MSQSKPNIEELLQRIRQLLNVLNMISEDLQEVSNSLKTLTQKDIAPFIEKNVEGVQALFPKELEKMLDFEEEEGYVVIKPRQFLGSENFAKIASVVRDAGGEYISAGKKSHFRISSK